MKKWATIMVLFSGVLICLVAFFTFYDKESQTELALNVVTGAVSCPSKEVVSLNRKEIEFNAKYIRTGSPIGEFIWQTACVVSSKSELYNYCSLKRAYYQELESSGLQELYSDDWFAEHQLIIVALDEGQTSGPQIHHKVVSVIKQDNEYWINIDREIPMDQKEDSWHILIEVGKASLSQNSIINTNVY